MLLAIIRRLLRRKIRVKSTEQLHAGDHLFVYKKGHTYAHHGIYIGNGKVVQYSGFADQLASAPVEIVDIMQFSCGKPYYIRKYPHWLPRKYSRQEIVRRAISRVGENYYSIVNNNCEHLAIWCVTGTHRSNQVNRIILTLNSNLVLMALNLLEQKFYPHLIELNVISTSLMLTVLLISAFATSIAIAIKLTDRFMLYYKHRATDCLEVKSRFFGKTVGLLCGLFTCCLMILWIDNAAATATNSQTTIVNGLSVIGQNYHAGTWLGFVIVLIIPCLAVCGTSWLAYLCKRWLQQYCKQCIMKLKSLHH